MILTASFWVFLTNPLKHPLKPGMLYDHKKPLLHRRPPPVAIDGLESCQDQLRWKREAQASIGIRVLLT